MHWRLPLSVFIVDELRTSIQLLLIIAACCNVGIGPDVINVIAGLYRGMIHGRMVCHFEIPFASAPLRAHIL